jgi:hypothetical protein
MSLRFTNADPNKGKIIFTIGLGSSVRTLTSIDSSWTKGRRYHVAVAWKWTDTNSDSVLDQMQASFWIDGKLQSTPTTISGLSYATWAAATATMYLGAANSDSGIVQFFNGGVDAFRLMNTTPDLSFDLSSIPTLANYDSQMSNTVYRYDFDTDAYQSGWESDATKKRLAVDSTSSFTPADAFYLSADPAKPSAIAALPVITGTSSRVIASAPYIYSGGAVAAQFATASDGSQVAGVERIDSTSLAVGSIASPIMQLFNINEPAGLSVYNIRGTSTLDRIVIYRDTNILFDRE